MPAPMSAAMKFVLAAPSVKVMTAVWPMASVVAFDVTVTVGATVLTAMEVAPEVFWLPAASVNDPAGTVTVAAPVKLAVGVKVAVNTVLVPLGVSTPIVPPVVTTSPAMKLVLASLSLKVMVAVCEPLTLATLDSTVTVGAIESMFGPVAEPILFKVSVAGALSLVAVMLPVMPVNSIPSVSVRPDSTVYRNCNCRVPSPARYWAERGTPPMSKPMTGVPATSTGES